MSVYIYIKSNLLGYIEKTIGDFTSRDQELLDHEIEVRAIECHLYVQ